MVGDQICKRCGEAIPPLSRICPYCLYNDSFTNEYEYMEILSPVPMLNMMRDLMEEYLAADIPKIWQLKEYDRKPREAFVTFETVRDVVVISFGKNQDVADAVTTMEDIIYDHAELRRKQFRRNKIVLLVLSTTLISSLSALVYLTLRAVLES